MSEVDRIRRKARLTFFAVLAALPFMYWVGGFTFFTGVMTVIGLLIMFGAWLTAETAA